MGLLSRKNTRSQHVVMHKVHNCRVFNYRTQEWSEAQTDKLARVLFDNSLTMHTTLNILADQNFNEGDRFYVTRREYPEQRSSDRVAKFIETKEIGISVKEITVIGTIDVGATPT